LIMKNMFGAKVRNSSFKANPGRAPRSISRSRAARAGRPLRLVVGLDQEHQARNGCATRRSTSWWCFRAREGARTSVPNVAAHPGRKRRPTSSGRSWRVHLAGARRSDVPFLRRAGHPRGIARPRLRAAFDATMKDPEFVAGRREAPPRSQPNDLAWRSRRRASAKSTRWPKDLIRQGQGPPSATNRGMIPKKCEAVFGKDHAHRYERSDGV